VERRERIVVLSIRDISGFGGWGDAIAGNFGICQGRCLRVWLRFVGWSCCCTGIRLTVSDFICVDRLSGNV